MFQLAQRDPVETVGQTGVFTFSMGTSPDKIEQGRRGVRREIKALREETFTEEDLRRRINSVTGRLQMRMLSSLNRGFYLAQAERENRPHTFDEDYRQILLSLTPAQVKEAARKYLPERLREVIIR